MIIYRKLGQIIQIILRNKIVINRNKPMFVNNLSFRVANWQACSSINHCVSSWKAYINLNKQPTLFKINSSDGLLDKSATKKFLQSRESMILCHTCYHYQQPPNPKILNEMELKAHVCKYISKQVFEQFQGKHRTNLMFSVYPKNANFVSDLVNLLFF